MTDAALLAVVDAEAWLRSANAGVTPAVDLCASWAKLSEDEFREVARSERVAGSLVLQQLVGLEGLRRRGRVCGWAFVAAEAGGPIRVDLALAAGSPKMIILRA